MISVIIPNYNCKPLLGRCINSVRRQTHRDWECIVVDDASTDGSREELEKIVAQDKRFTLICKDSNGGLPAARNTGMEHAKSDALFFLDSDDWIEPNALQTLAVEADLHPEAGRIVGLDFLEYPKYGWAWKHSIKPAGLHLPDSPYLFANGDCDVGHATGCLYIKSRIPCELKFPDIPLFEDMIFNMGLIFAGVPLFITNQCIYRYVRRDGSLLSHWLSEENAEKIRLSLRRLAKEHKAKPEVYERFQRFLDNAIKGRMKDGK